MSKYLIALAIAGAMSVPVAAQTAPQPPAGQPQAAKPQTVKKVICERVDVEETTGSRLGSAPKKCKTVEVPAPRNGGSNGQQAPSPATSNGNSF